MEQIKKLFQNWDVSRVIRLVLAIAFGVGYLVSKESIYMFAAIFLGAQAVFNISCPGGSCSTTPVNEEKPIVKVEKYEPKN
ncbi:MAG: hypothetical protein GZ091_17655 [Paludibacter sp.]|nr:hypothetical protein [Paludibacter sp.]